MPRYYYDEARHALDALLDHGIKTRWTRNERDFADQDEKSLRCDVSYICDVSCPYEERYYIHPDSLHLLQPQVGDDVEFNSIKARYCGMTGHNTHIVTTRTPNYPEPPRVASYELAPNTRFIIEKRNGIPFFWPKTEASEISEGVET